MKLSILSILLFASVARKCAQESAEQGSKRLGREAIENSSTRAGREALENGSKSISHNSAEILARVSAKTARYYFRDFNNENKFVSYVDSTNTFIIDNEK